MTVPFLETWRRSLKTHLANFAPLIHERPAIDPIHSLIGAALLWEIRERRAEHIAALSIVCGGEPHLTLLTDAIDGWKKRSPLEALEELDSAQRQSSALKAALTAVLNHFLQDLFAENALSIDISGSVSGANVNIGSHQVILGDAISHFTMRPKIQRSCPRPPKRPDHFGGRQTILDDLVLKLAGGESAAIMATAALQGTGGIGKTTLAKMLADALYTQKKFKAVLWANVTRVPNAANVLSDWVISYADSSFDLSAFKGDLGQIAAAAKNHLEAVIDEACETCEPPRVLVVLDDVWENGIEAARILKAASPAHSTLLITTRSIKVAAAFYIVPDKIGYLEPDDAAALLFAYLPQVDAVARRRLGVALGGYPLALELAVRRVLNEAERHPSLTDAVNACAADYETGIPAGKAFKDLQLEEDEAKENNVTVSLSHSYDSLTDAARAHFRALGVLAVDVPFDRAVLAALWDIPVEAVDHAADPLRYLGLVELKEGAYAQHALLRAYAHALLNASGDLEAASRRHFEHYRAQHGDHDTNNNEDRHPLIQADFGNIQVALAWGWFNQLEAACAFVEALAYYMGLRETRPTQRTLLQTALKSAETIDYRLGQARMLEALGDVSLQENEHEAARGWYERALALYEQVGSQQGQANTLKALGHVSRMENEYEAARVLYERALSLFEQSGDRLGQANTLEALGDVSLRENEHEAALGWYARALPLYEQRGARLGQATTLRALGDVSLRENKYEAARVLYERALPLFEQSGSRLGQAHTLKALGDVSLRENEYDAALGWYARALPLYEQIGDRLGQANTLKTLGDVSRLKNEYEAARVLYKRALPLYEQIEGKVGKMNTYSNLARLSRAIGEMAAARTYFEQALAIADAHPFFRTHPVIEGWRREYQHLLDSSQDDQ